MLSPGEQQVVHAEGELAGGVAGGAPDLQGPVADLDLVAVVDDHVDLAAGHGDADVLGVDPGVGEDFVPLLDGLHALGMRGDLALQHFTGPGEALGVIDVGVRGEDHLAVREVELELADQFEDVDQVVEESHVDQGVLAPAVDQVDVHTHPAAGLIVHLDDAGEQIQPLGHIKNPVSRARSRLARGSYTSCPDAIRALLKYDGGRPRPSSIPQHRIEVSKVSKARGRVGRGSHCQPHHCNSAPPADSTQIQSHPGALAPVVRPPSPKPPAADESTPTSSTLWGNPDHRRDRRRRCNRTPRSRNPRPSLQKCHRTRQARSIL